MPFCPYCGELVIDDAVFCSHCGKDLKPVFIPEREGLVEHLKFAVNLAVKNPVIFVPEIIGALLLQGIYFRFSELMGSSIFSSYFESLLGTNVSYVQYGYPDIPPEHLNTFLLIGLAMIIGIFLIAGLSGLFTFATVKLVDDCINGSISLGTAFSYVLSRFGILFWGSVVANIFGVTVILLPVAFFTYVIMVVDETGIRDSLSKSFKLFMNNISSSIVIILLYYLSRMLIGYVPYISEYLLSIPSGLLAVVLYDMYINQKEI